MNLFQRVYNAPHVRAMLIVVFLSLIICLSYLQIQYNILDGFCTFVTETLTLSTLNQIIFITAQTLIAIIAIFGCYFGFYSLKKLNLDLSGIVKSSLTLFTGLIATYIVILFTLQICSTGKIEFLGILVDIKAEILIIILIIISLFVVGCVLLFTIYMNEVDAFTIAFMTFAPKDIRLNEYNCVECDCYGIYQKIALFKMSSYNFSKHGDGYHNMNEALKEYKFEDIKSLVKDIKSGNTITSDKEKILKDIFGASVLSFKEGEYNLGSFKHEKSMYKCNQS